MGNPGNPCLFDTWEKGLYTRRALPPLALPPAVPHLAGCGLERLIVHVRDRRPEFDPEQLLRNVKQTLARFKSRLPIGSNVGLPVLLFLGLATLVWLGTGFYTVGPSEQAGLRLFGEFRGTEGTGLHWYPPAPIGTRNIEAVQETKTLELGFRERPSPRLADRSADDHRRPEHRRHAARRPVPHLRPGSLPV